MMQHTMTPVWRRPVSGDGFLTLVGHADTPFDIEVGLLGAAQSVFCKEGEPLKNLPNEMVARNVFELLRLAANDHGRKMGANIHYARCLISQLVSGKRMVLTSSIDLDTLAIEQLDKISRDCRREGLEDWNRVGLPVLDLEIIFPEGQTPLRLILTTGRVEEPGEVQEVPCAPDPTICSHCKLSSQNLRTCGKCLLARYCSEACQRADWKEHKHVCHSGSGHAVKKRTNRLLKLFGQPPKNKEEEEAILVKLNMQNAVGVRYFS